ncbi:MAG: DUF3603 family protein [Bacilli bacterium]|nr:DUF3603 family protein [Bacilli bacterium]
MNYIYDLVLNFSENERILEFYEWMKEDVLSTVAKIPIIRINRFQMNDILNNKISITKTFLKKYENKTLLDDGSLLKYSFLVTDLSKVIALEFSSNGEVIRRSSLLLDEEEAVIEESLDYQEEELNYKIIRNYLKFDFLTRDERKIRSSLINELNYLYKNKKYDEINYLYEELFNKKISIHDKYKFLIDDISNNYSSKYNRIYDIIKMT